MSKLLMLKGLPASGKTTWAKTAVEHSKAVRINKDDLRAMCFDGRFTHGRENVVLALRDAMIVELAKSKSYDTIVVDDTNLSPKHETRLRELAGSLGLDFEINDDFLSVPLEECITRDSKRDKPVGRAVILNMYNQYLLTEYVPNPNLPECVICDLDGTLALFDGNPYERDFSQDVPSLPVLNLIAGKRIVFLSGRNGKFKSTTEEWLKKHVVGEYELHMRQEGDNRKDSVLKRELYDLHVKDRYKVAFVVDDRPQVVRLWRSLGLFVFDVNQKGVEF